MIGYDAIVDRIVAEATRLLGHQPRGEDHPWRGAYVPPEAPLGTATADHVHASRHLAVVLAAFLAPGSSRRGDPELLASALAAVGFLGRSQRPSGLVDLPAINWESPPDTAFVVQLLVPLHDLARAGDDVPGAAGLADALAAFLRPAALGLVGRGFHTPNHRWVVASALALARRAFPDTAATLSPYLDAILAEGIDVDADGDYLERSPGIYHAVSNRALRLLAAVLGEPRYRAMVRRNLALCADLLQPDGTIDTSRSTRQDRGARIVPTALADSFLDLAHEDGHAGWSAIACRLFEQAQGRPEAWWLHPYLAGMVPREACFGPSGSLPEVDRHFATAGFHRWRRGRTAATVAAGQPDFLVLRHGAIELRGTRLATTYSPLHVVTGDVLGRVEGGVRLRFDGTARAPHYQLPLGEPVPPDCDWEAVRARRGRFVLPPLHASVDVLRAPGGFVIEARLEGGVPGLLGWLELAFAGPGTWETDDQATPAQPGSHAFLKAGSGVFHVGGDALRVGPGAGGLLAHRLADSRVYAPDREAFRVILPFRLPAPTAWRLDLGSWDPAQGFTSAAG